MRTNEKMRLSVDPMAAITFVVMLLSDRTHVVAGILLAAAVHELGHLLAARVLHIPIRQMRLDLLGARLDVGGRMLSYGEEWALCAAGPIFSLMLSAACAPFWSVIRGATELSCLSLLLGGLNLMPIRGFDGGRMLSAFLSATVGERSAERVIAVCSVLFAMLLWGLAVYLLLKIGDGLSLLFFSMGILLRFFPLSQRD